MRLHNCVHTIHAALSQTFTRATESGRSMGGCNFGCNQWAVAKKFQKHEYYYLEPSLHTSITDIVEAMNSLIKGRHNYSEKCITVKLSRKAQKVEFYRANEGSGLAFFSTDLGHIFESNVDKEC